MELRRSLPPVFGGLLIDKMSGLSRCSICLIGRGAVFRVTTPKFDNRVVRRMVGIQ
jgi:hypothetical protein